MIQRIPDPYRSRWESYFASVLIFAHFQQELGAS
jgi:hypothetical protein